MFAYLILIALIFPPAPAHGLQFTLAYAIVDGEPIKLEGNRIGDVYVTPLGNATIEKDTYRHLIFNATRNATRLFEVHGEYERFEVRRVGYDRDVVFYVGDYVVFFHTKFPLECNGTHIRFSSGSFVVDVGVYRKGSLYRPTLALIAALAILIAARKLFPNRSG